MADDYGSLVTAMLANQGGMIGEMASILHPARDNAITRRVRSTMLAVEDRATLRDAARQAGFAEPRFTALFQRREDGTIVGRMTSSDANVSMKTIAGRIYNDD